MPIRGPHEPAGFLHCVVDTPCWSRRGLHILCDVPYIGPFFSLVSLLVGLLPLFLPGIGISIRRMH